MKKSWKRRISVPDSLAKEKKNRKFLMFKLIWSLPFRIKSFFYLWYLILTMIIHLFIVLILSRVQTLLIIFEIERCRSIHFIHFSKMKWTHVYKTWKHSTFNSPSMDGTSNPFQKNIEIKLVCLVLVSKISMNFLLLCNQFPLTLKTTNLFHFSSIFWIPRVVLA